MDKALDQFEALGKMPGSDIIQVHLKIGLIYLEQKEPGKAVDEFLLVLTAQPDDHRVRYFLGSAYAENGEPAAAIETFKIIPPEALIYPEARLYWAYLLELASQLDEAIAVVKETLVHYDHKDKLWGFLCALYEEKKDYEKAIQAIKMAVERAKNPAQHHFTLGILYEKIGAMDKSIEAMKTAISLDPDNADALNFLGYTYADRGLYLEEAEKLIQKALKIRPRDGYIIDSLGWVYFRQGRYQEAIEELNRAKLLVMDDPIILEHLGDAYQKVDEHKRALEVYLKAVEKAGEENR